MTFQTEQSGTGSRVTPSAETATDASPVPDPKSPPTPPAGSSGPGGVEGANRGAAASPGATPPERPTPPDRPSGGSTRAGRDQGGPGTTVPAGTKRCGVCKQHKGPTAFHTDRSRGDGLRWCCRACFNTAERDRRGRKRRDPRKGWCPNCKEGRHGRSCTAAFFGPDCACRCSVLGYRGPFTFADPTAPAPMDRGVA